MIVKLKNKDFNDEIIKIITKKNLEVKIIDDLTFLIIGETTNIEPRDLYAFSSVLEVVRISTPFKKVSRAYKSSDTIINLPNNIKIGGNNFTVIAGPCSVESEEQLTIIAKALKKANVNIMRAGAFKPRTSPYAFQGLEEEGLKLLKKVADSENLLVVSEIPSPEYIPLFEETVDIIQVGARNMQNYHLLKALGKAKKPILLKRGLSATIEEWLMAAEYLIEHGNDNIILCERGIRTFEKYTRNTFDISAVLAVKELSHLPVITDPSHATGRWEMVERLSLASKVVGANGIMIEVHNEPTKALSDGAQSLNLTNFNKLMEKL